MSAKYTSFKEELKRNINQRIEQIAQTLSEDAELQVKEEFTRGNFYKAPVQTGTLRRSVRGKVKQKEDGKVLAEVRTDSEYIRLGIEAQTGSNSSKLPKEVTYAKYIEFGTSKMPARPFMRGGMAKATQRAMKIIQALLK